MQVFEISFECGNKVGGIHTVISSKAGEMVRLFGEDYICIGFYNERRAREEVIPEKVPEEWRGIFEELEGEGIKCTYGKWLKGGKARIILVDSKEFESKKVNEIKTEHWIKYRVDSLFAGEDYNEPVAWGYAVGKLLEKIGSFPFIAHFHEWLSGSALLYLNERISNLPSVFTTHATFFARVIGASVEDVKRLKEEEIERKAKELGIIAKHQMEKICAQKAKVVTTVSDITKIEVEKILGREVDVITYNALDISAMKNYEDIIAEAEMLRERLEKFLIAYFSPYYGVEVKDKPILFTSGRYEFWNKGFDLFIESLGKLNERLKGKTEVFAFILVPSDVGEGKEEIAENILLFDRLEEILDEKFEETKKKILYKIGKGEKIGVKDIVEEELIANISGIVSKMKRKGLPPLCPFHLNYDERSDLILENLRRYGLKNRKDDAVKVIFYPRYLKTSDELLRLSYKEFLEAADIGIFMSRYEPFGYTPLEASVYITCSITSDYSGFGNLIRKYGREGKGVWVIHAVNREREDVIEEIAKVLENLCLLSRERLEELKINARKSVEIFDWRYMVKNYLDAYRLALERARIKRQLIN